MMTKIQVEEFRASLDPIARAAFDTGYQEGFDFATKNCEALADPTGAAVGDGHERFPQPEYDPDLDDAYDDYDPYEDELLVNDYDYSFSGFYNSEHNFAY